MLVLLLLHFCYLLQILCGKHQSATRQFHSRVILFECKARRSQGKYLESGTKVLTEKVMLNLHCRKILNLCLIKNLEVLILYPKFITNDMSS